jgi:hypothetical protein
MVNAQLACNCISWIGASWRCIGLQIDQAIAKVKMHDLLLRFGFIGSLKSFLEPLETPKTSASGSAVLTLPHSKVRATVYRALHKLPINTEQPEGRDMLKAAGIGPVLNFYAKVKDENAENRRLVQDLLMSWMAPMIEEGRKAALKPDYEAQRRDVRFLVHTWPVHTILCVFAFG